MHTRKILVPLDGSPVSEAALPFAEALAHRTGAPLALIRAEHTQSAAAIADAERYLDGFAEQFANRGLATRAHDQSSASSNPIRCSWCRWMARSSPRRRSQ